MNTIDAIRPNVINLCEAKPSNDNLSCSATKKNQQISWPPSITLKSDNGMFLSRINRGNQDNCEASKNPDDLYCSFKVELIPNEDNMIALKGDNNKYLSRINRGRVNHVEFAKDQLDAFCKFKYIYINDNTIALKGDTGLFLSRIRRGKQDNIEVEKNEIDSYSKFIIGEHLLRKEITNVEYDLVSAKAIDTTPLVTLECTVENPFDTDIVKTLEYSYQKSTVGTWNNEFGVSVGAAVKFFAGIPSIIGGEITVTTDLSYKHVWGGSKSTTETITDTTQVTVPAKSRIKMQVVVLRKVIDVNFTYTLIRTLTDSTVETYTDQKGTYHNVDGYESSAKIMSLEKI
ncbi:hypothetical protein [uncultured Photobacterium sp.]|uniref:hypothetical protein n=1 Tax=uncultured Photobacterium sp. TaxID=173973 RepID=UPI002604D1F2|nr:hypothetical protein [uncultured Photobacterium sp.]